MLYIFQVDTGQMICFEMDVAISTVNTLKSKIATTHGIPMDKQVLLVSGGEILEGTSRVCDYAAGTDTNPIFLFNKLNIEGQTIQADVSGFVGGSDSSLNNVQMADLETIHKQIDNTNSLPPTYMSVVTRAQLAQHVYEMGKEITRKCEVLIHHQHLQHQGWAAVVANLDDIVGLFTSKLGGFVNAYEAFCKETMPQDIDSFVDGLELTLKTLDTIRIPNYYVDATSNDPEHQQHHHHKSVITWLSEHYTTNNSNKTSSTPLHTHLQSTATSTRKTYDALTCTNFLQSLQQEAVAVIDKAQSPNMKEIKGLEERLYGLDQLLQEAKSYLVDQHEMTQAFNQNVSRANDVRDSSIFPDLCASHQHQLLVMYKNHSQLEDIRRRCSKAKEELTINLNTRLKWIAFVQKSLSEMGGKIGVYHESLRRLRVNVNVLQQVHECERVFNSYVREVRVRKRVGTRLGELVGKITEFNRVAERENTRRDAFTRDFAGHFLSQAFSVLVDDCVVQCVAVPKLVEYRVDDVGAPAVVGEDDDYFHSQQIGSGADEQVDVEKISLKGRVKELEGIIANVNLRKEEVEKVAAERGKVIDVERERVRTLNAEVDSAKHDAAREQARVDKLGAQVEDLKALIDEFRVKEDDSIRLRQVEIAECNDRIRDIESKCNERVVELTRMLEFECAQKIKNIEENHKLEMVAMVKRFKLVNECSQKMRVSEGGSLPPPLSPVSRGRMASECDDRVKFGSSREIVFSDDEDSDAAAAVVMVDRRRNDSIRLDDYTTLTDEHHQGNISSHSGDGSTGSLERAQDAGAVLLQQQDENVQQQTLCSGGMMSPTSTTTSADFGVPETIVSVALRLNNLSRVSVTSCRVGGQANLFYWNDKFNAYTVYLSNRNVHFLNTSERNEEDREGTALIRDLGKNRIFVANIIDKEFCVARRAQNRYNVPQGFHFTRVRVCAKSLEIINNE